MNTLSLKHLIWGCLCLLLFAVFALSISAQTLPEEGDQFVYLPIIQVEEEDVGGTVPTRTPTP